MKPQEIFLSILGLPLRASTTRMVVPSSHGGNINMLTKYALAAVIVLCLTGLGFTLLVGDSLCEFTVKERNIEFKVVLAYEPKK